jgi:hypothetical protein
MIAPALVRGGSRGGKTREVTAADRLTIRMAPGGGWLARFTKE